MDSFIESGLDVEKKPAWILNNVFDATEEQNGLSSIYQTVVISQCNVHHWP